MNSATTATAAAAQSPALRSFEAQWRDQRPDPLAELRREAMQRFMRLGLPTSRDESWRYTSLRNLAARSFIAADGGAEPPLPAAAARTRICAGLPAIAIVNGYPQLAKSTSRLPDGLQIRSLRASMQAEPDWLLRRLTPLSDEEQQRWALLNVALFADGLHIEIGARVGQPLLLLHKVGGGAANAAAHARVIIDAAPDTSATIIEYHAGGGEQPTLSNSATQILLAENSSIEHYRVFATGEAAMNLDTLDIRQDGNSRCKQFTIALGGGLLRTNLDACLQQAGASLDSYALLVGHGSRHVDCVNVARHAAPRTESRQTARAIASGTSRVIFNSKVTVNPGAAGADSRQSCRGLLLDPTAEIDTRPQLEIHADEVKCAHGATTGRLDPDMLFYMLSRGIDRMTAQSLLVYAFLADVLTGMTAAAARTEIETGLIAQLPDAERLRAFR